MQTDVLHKGTPLFAPPAAEARRFEWGWVVIGICVLFAGFGYRTARENTQLVWMLSAPQL